MKKLTIFTLMALLLLGSSVAWAASGYLVVPDHHAGVVGDNDITVTATELEAGVEYLILLNVSYHENPRTSPPEEEIPPTGYTTTVQFLSDGSDFTQTFVVRLPECVWQITADFTLLYWNGLYWLWNGDERATEGVDIWSDCVGEGCTPGFWKNPKKYEIWPADPYTSFLDVFGVGPDIPLKKALKLGGGGENALVRHGAAGYLNALSLEVDYFYTDLEVIAIVQEAYATSDFESAKDMLELQNDPSWCPL